MTFDTTSRLGVPTRPERSPNTRTPALDLDSVYGGGPTADPQLYDPADRAKFKVEHGGLFEDLPRASDGTAIIADPRNDENLMIAGLQAAFLLFHNRVVDKLRDDGEDRRLARARPRAAFAAGNARTDDRRRSVFSEARRLVTWHYQWIIVNEFLPQIIGAPLVERHPVARAAASTRRGRASRTFRWSSRPPPIASATAWCGRRTAPTSPATGHAVLRVHLRSGRRGSGRPGRSARRRAGAEALHRLADLLRLRRRPDGQRPAAQDDRHQDLDAAVPPAAGRHRQRRPADVAAAAQPAPPPDLVASLRPGDRQAMRIPALTPQQLSELAQFGVGFERSTPLWYYMLKEAEVAGGARLAGVGARIVGEVFLGLLTLDRNSYLSQNRALAADVAEPCPRHLRDGRSADVRRRRSGEPAPVAAPSGQWRGPEVPCGRPAGCRTTGRPAARYAALNRVPIEGQRPCFTLLAGRRAAGRSSERRSRRAASAAPASAAHRSGATCICRCPASSGSSRPGPSTSRRIRPRP